VFLNFHTILMQDFSLAFQWVATGLFIVAGLHIARSVVQSHRRLQQLTVALADMKKSVQSAIDDAARQAAETRVARP